jgi:ABC-type glycerol-3-phosphate transport system permease component
MKLHTGLVLNKVTLLILLGFCSFIVLLPIIWMIIFSFGETSKNSGLLSLIPQNISLKGYIQVFKTTPFLRWLQNSLFVAVVQTFLQVFIGFFAAYAFTRLKFPGRTILFYFVLATMVIPTQALMIPTFVTINFFNMINTFAGVIVPYIASGYAIFLLRQYFMGVPQALVDAARVDGCGELRTMWHIYFPVSLPSIGALAIILFVSHWNEYYWPLLVLTDEKIMTLPIALVRFRNEGIIEWMPTLAASTMATLPVILLFILTQKSFVEGFTSSGIKG